MGRNHRDTSLLASIMKRCNSIAAVVGYAFIIKHLSMGTLSEELIYLIRILKEYIYILVSGT